MYHMFKWSCTSIQGALINWSNGVLKLIASENLWFLQRYIYDFAHVHILEVMACN
jgi:hypothetical protein